MKRHYYISDDLDELDAVEHSLEQSGITTPQIHVLSENDSGVESHHLHAVESVLKKDVVRSTEIGFIVGLVASLSVLLLAYYSGLTETFTWVPAIFLAIVVLGFCTWEGGLVGIQTPHHDFARFQQPLHEGKHVFFVDVEPSQEANLDRIIAYHPSMQLAGMGEASPNWVVAIQQAWHRFVHWAP